MNETNEPTPTPVSWSPSALQRMTTCEYSYYQRYIAGHSSRQHASAWFGGEIVHRMIQLAYHGLSFQESFDQVWTTTCTPILAELQTWFDLDRDYRLTRGGKRSDSKDAVAWLKANPSYGESRERIDAYQRTAFAYLRWNERTSLADYYRRAAVLTEVSRESVLLANPWLVEGQWIEEVDRDPFDGSPDLPAEDAELEDEEKGRTYTHLEGTIGGIHVRGVPDVVARRDDGTMLIGDYKTSARPLSAAQLSMNMQLLIYYELLRQNGIVLAGQKIVMGHIYLTETSVSQVWTDSSQYAGRMPLIERQLQHAERRRALGDFVPVAGIAPSFQDPCPTCDMAHVCDAVLIPSDH